MSAHVRNLFTTKLPTHLEKLASDLEALLHTLVVDIRSVILEQLQQSYPPPPANEILNGLIKIEIKTFKQEIKAMHSKTVGTLHAIEEEVTASFQASMHPYYVSAASNTDSKFQTMFILRMIVTWETEGDRHKTSSEKMQDGFNDHINNNAVAYFKACADKLKDRVKLVVKEEVTKKIEIQAASISNSVEHALHCALQIKLSNEEKKSVKEEHETLVTFAKSVEKELDGLREKLASLDWELEHPEYDDA